ncbi:phage minor head protein [Sulfitobacter sp. G21635-S1]|uniref:phage head morphogenesis protein n=1 Tax=Sulfitobacter sp. G21635-S1 TaxID=3014043 RepID=UPI0022B05F60|nr:phage minor head protein [Sulfitobacter sp. G21635-S1]MCZ4258994.1 phage minor head protein [Sulfitobacter sp. G21635-S1]
MAGIALEPLPPREALEYFRSKGYAPALQRFDYRDHWREEHARGFVVAKAMRDDVLALIRTAVEDGLSEGKTLDRFRKDLAPQLKAKGWWGKSIERDPLTGELKEVQLGSMHRLKVIFDTNLRTSYAAGQWARLQRTKAFLPYLEYRQLQRETARDEHKPYDGLILPIDHPLWRKIFPPNGWFCGCYVRPMNDRMLEREGKVLTSADEIAALETMPWTNPRTGETEALLEGIDPSFASNPGHAWQDMDDRHAASALDLPENLRASDRGYLKEMTALQMRGDRQILLAYDQAADPETAPLAFAQGETATPVEIDPALATQLANPGNRIALLRAGPTATPLAIEDLRLLAEAPGLHQVALASPDGSFFRMGRAAETALPPVDRIRDWHAEAVRIAARWSGRETLSNQEMALITNHALLSAMAEHGLIGYASAPSGRVQALLLRALDLLPEMVAVLGAR